MSDETDKTAKELLHKAILDYYKAVEPAAYVDGWVMVTQKFSMDLEAQGRSAVGRLVATDQSFALTRGLLDVALTAERDCE